MYKLRPKTSYAGGDKVGRDDHWLVLGVNVLDVIYELAQNPKWKGLITVNFPLIGEEINRFTHLPQNPYDLMQKQMMISLATRRVGGVHPITLLKEVML
jgi:aromatic ring hydroxylase